MKLIRKNESVSFKKNVEFANQRSERRTDNTCFIGLSVYEDQYAKKSWPYLIFWIYCWSFWSTFVTFSHVRPNPTNLLNVTLIIHLWDTFMQPEQSLACWEITQELEFFQTWNLGWKVKYHNHSPSREFLGKSSDKIKTITNALLWKPFCSNMSKNEFCTKLCYIIS